MIDMLLQALSTLVHALLDAEDHRPVSSLQPSTVKLPSFGRGFPPRQEAGSITA